MDMACDPLTRDDLICCLQVSRLWHRLFLPQVRRHVRFFNTSASQILDVLHNASRIKTLKIDIGGAGDFLDSTTLRFNLEELLCIDYPSSAILPIKAASS
ncbi:hypothetical protein BGX33_009231, partial [Mortierella sp. NVP41]